MINVKLLNYGNVGSLIAAFSLINVYPTVLGNPEDAIEADLLVLPGVGSAVSAHEFLVGPFAESLQSRHAAKKPTLGICLGAQLMFEFLEESNKPGLGWLKGSVRRFPEAVGFNNGWCHLDRDALARLNLTRGIRPDSTFYFNHQFYLPPETDAQIVNIAEHSTVPGLIVKDHLFGVQFHPEKSQRSGIFLLRNILEDYYGF